MSRRSIAIAFVAFLVVPAGATSTYASFHLWKFSEIFSNADGSVQFIEMLDPSDFENLVGGKTITSASTGKTFTFGSNLSTISTANHHLLIATPGFASLPGAVTPDFTLPSTNFFNAAGDTLTFAGGLDIRTFASVPTDGVNSRIYPANTTATNSPTNFAGQMGLLNLAAPTGDYNGNHLVDAADYVVWRNTLSQTVSSGSGADGNQSGSVDAGDYDFWSARFGNAAASGASFGTAIPEPAALALLCVASAALVIRRR